VSFPLLAHFGKTRFRTPRVSQIFFSRRSPFFPFECVFSFGPRFFFFKTLPRFDPRSILTTLSAGFPEADGSSFLGSSLCATPASFGKAFFLSSYKQLARKVLFFCKVVPPPLSSPLLTNSPPGKSFGVPSSLDTGSRKSFEFFFRNRLSQNNGPGRLLRSPFF